LGASILGNYNESLYKEVAMLEWALIFLVIAIVAGLFGFRGIASTATGIAKVLFFLFIVMFFIFLIMSMFGTNTPAVP
jgi:uncharacterized membrane protein YtjA (UPF0391 family)